MQCTIRWANGQRECLLAPRDRYQTSERIMRQADLPGSVDAGAAERKRHASGEQWGWIACPPELVGGGERRRHRRQWGRPTLAWEAGWAWLRRSWMVPAIRSEALVALVCLTDRQAWG